MTDGADALIHDLPPNDAAAAGALLRAAREAAGLSVAAVAQQLKLAPRQVAALEEGDFTKLPGRTFVRGFMRNYARLLQLDSDAVLAALPENVAAPSLEHPSLAPTPRPMGELPAEVHAKPNPARWAIPLGRRNVRRIGGRLRRRRLPMRHRQPRRPMRQRLQRCPIPLGLATTRQPPCATMRAEWMPTTRRRLPNLPAPRLP